MRTDEARYSERILRNESVWWKRLLDVQRPYRTHLRHLRLGLVLEVGCGVGRNLRHLGAGAAVGVDTNRHAVEIARSRGAVAFTPDELRASSYATRGRFDSLLLSHVVEHMTLPEAASLVRDYLDLVRDGGTVVVITPQEAGFRSDPTHVEFMDFEKVERVLRDAGVEPVKRYSFPLPRITGRIFKYNEFVSIGRKNG